MDPPAMGQRAVSLIESGSALVVTGAALAETSHVLRSVYHVDREVLVDLLIALVQRANISVRHVDQTIAVEALLRCRPSGRISIPDALIWAAARHDAPSEVYSFDRRFPSDSISLREPL